jgi:hypothetical protein
MCHENRHAGGDDLCRGPPGHGLREETGNRGEVDERRGEQSSEKTIDAIAINQAISLFHATEGRFPKDLNELVTEKYMPKVPDAPYGMKIVYDADRGQARIVPK